MKLVLEDFGGFIKSTVSPVANFITRSTPSADIILKIIAGKQNSIVCSSNDRMMEVFFDGEVQKPGESYIFASAIKDIKTSHKKAILTKSDNKVLVTSGTKNRSLSLAIDCASSEGFFDFRNVPSTKASPNKIDLATFNSFLGGINITPVMTPGESAMLTLASENGNKENKLVMIVNDSSRIFKLTDLDSKISFDQTLITDFKDLQATISTLSYIVKDANISFNKKVLMATGFDEDGKKRVNIIINLLVSDATKVDKSNAILNMARKKKPVMGFITDDAFKEGLNNVIGLASLRAKDSGHLDLELKKDSLIITASGPSSVYKERIKVKGVGSGTVRIGSNMLIDIVKSIPKKAMFKVNSNMILITGAIKTRETLMVIPFINLSK